MEEQSYQQLAEHLDRLRGGFAPSETGAELRLLKGLFTPEEAAVIADRAGLLLTETEQRLNEMAHKGLIFSVHPEDGCVLYQAVPWIVEIWEFQVNRLSQGLFRDLASYWRTQKETAQVETIPHPSPSFRYNVRLCSGNRARSLSGA